MERRDLFEKINITQLGALADFFVITNWFVFCTGIKIQSAIVTASADPKTEVLISLITNLEAETAALEERLASIRQETEALIGQAATGESQLTELQNQLTQAQIQAGITALEGPGITIQLDDNNSGLSNSPTDDPNRYIIHYENLLYLVNDLRKPQQKESASMASALWYLPEIRCVGNVILVNTTRLAPPLKFRLSAILTHWKRRLQAAQPINS